MNSRVLEVVLRVRPDRRRATVRSSRAANVWAYHPAVEWLRWTRGLAWVVGPDAPRTSLVVRALTLVSGAPRLRLLARSPAARGLATARPPAWKVPSCH
eukprot:15479466-Alexandrium_andersonii.AAC.1